MRNFWVRLVLAALIAVGIRGMAGAGEAKPVKYVFLFIGDGMSYPQRQMADEYLQRTEGRGLVMNELPFQAATHTRAANAFITDSAAAGTAIACGEKTNNGVLGLAPDGRRLRSVAEVARDAGRKVGIVTSVTLNHATPAAFYAHNDSRGNAYAIGLDLIASGFDYFGGGGLDDHDNRNVPGYRGDVYELARAAGYTVARTPEDFARLAPGAGKAISLGAEGALPYAIDTRDGAPRLADFTRQAIVLLDNPDGFFLMVEGGMIDWAGHANDAGAVLRETLDFDDAVRVARAFALRNPGDTLLVVTGDHETGGMTLGSDGGGSQARLERLDAQRCSAEALARALAAAGGGLDREPVFDDVKPVLRERAGLIFPGDGEPPAGAVALTEGEAQELREAFGRSLKDGRLENGSPLAAKAVRILADKAAIAWTTGGHTALQVSTTAWGRSADAFSGTIDNTDIARHLKRAVR